MILSTIIKKSHKNALLEHINSIDNNIKFTCEESRDDSSIPFLDIPIIPEEDGRLNTTIYRKPTHTDLFLQWDSHHNIPSKYSVIGTLFHRAKTICSSPQILQKLRTSNFSFEEMQVSNLGPTQSQTKEPQKKLLTK